MKTTFEAKKKFGQNFLNSNEIAFKISNILNLKNQNVIEIGPGNLILTKQILNRNPKNFVTIEIDEDLIKKNASTINELNLKCINQDALIFSEIKYFNKKKFFIISNLPFNISTKLLIKWIKCQFENKYISGMVLMFQKELGERIISEKNSKRYGRISIFTQTVFNVKKKMIVKKENFYPIPKVDAIVIEFTPIKNTNKINFEKLEIITNFFFNSRRKKNKKKILQLFTSDQIKKNKLDNFYNLRAENLSKEDFWMMSNLI